MSSIGAWALFWLAAVCCAAAELAILRTVWRTHPQPAAAGDAPRQKRAMEIAWALLPAIALVAVFFFTWRALRTSETAPRASRAPASAPFLS
jgi:heme/copper-type cytochrome/quinol oxidase subunit 2